MVVGHNQANNGGLAPLPLSEVPSKKWNSNPKLGLQFSGPFTPREPVMYTGCRTWEQNQGNYLDGWSFEAFKERLKSHLSRTLRQKNSL